MLQEEDLFLQIVKEMTELLRSSVLQRQHSNSMDFKML